MRGAKCKKKTAGPARRGLRLAINMNISYAGP